MPEPIQEQRPADWDDEPEWAPEWDEGEEYNLGPYRGTVIDFGNEAEFDIRFCATCRRYTTHVVLGRTETVVEEKCTDCFTGIKAVAEPPPSPMYDVDDDLPF